MRLLRILIVTHAPLAAEFGAGQMAINLAEALRSQGHNVILWSPHSLTNEVEVSWWKSVQTMRAKLDAFIKNQQQFDLIDSPALFITKNVRKTGETIVARNVQPEILYILNNLNNHFKFSLKDLIRLPFSYLYSFFQVLLIVQGWTRADFIFCLGSLEFHWMKRWFPYWKNKIFFYVNALSPVEQQVLKEILQSRKKPVNNEIKFLWIGRWVAHKGTDNLINFIIRWNALRPQDSFTIAGCGYQTEVYFPRMLLDSGKLVILPCFKRNKIFSLLKSHDIGLFTSKVEGWGLVLNEMLEAGMPIFAVQAGGVPDLLPFSKGMIKPFPPSPETVLDELVEGVNLCKYYEKFNWLNIANLYLDSIRV